MNTDKTKELLQKYSIIKKFLYPVFSARRSFLQMRYNSLLKKKLPVQKELLKNIGEILIGDPVIRVDEFDGIFAVDSRSHIFAVVMMNKCYEQQLSNLCIKYLDKNKDAIDVGANIGFYSVLFAKNINQKRVLSIEPTKDTLKRLRRNIDLNNVSEKVEIFEGVISNSVGTVEIKVIKGKEEYSSLGEMQNPWITNEQWSSELVNSITLDKLVEDRSLNPGFIKIDVEGVEHLVFEGAQKVLKENRPIILSELWDFILKKNGSSAIEVISMIRSQDYEVFDPINPSINPEKGESVDIICFPKESLALKNFVESFKV